MEPPRPSLGRVVGLNLAALVVVSVVLFTFMVATAPANPAHLYPLSYGIVLSAYGVLHIGGLLLVGLGLLFTQRRALGQALLLSALAVLLVGASFCFGGLFALDAVV